MAPHICPHCEDILDNIFPLPPYSVDDADPHPILKTYSPDYTPCPDLNTTLQPITNTRPSTPSIPLEPPLPYDSLFATAVLSDSASAPPNIWIDPYCWNTDAGSDWD